AQYYERACNNYINLACNNLGRMVLEGRGGLARDETRAFNLFDSACIQGEQTACVSLGGMYESGQGVAKDVDRAIGLYEQVCNWGYGIGCGRFGQMHAKGAGSLKRDKDKARQYFRLGCDY